MRLKTFLATFLLFLVILFTSLSVVSIYMTRNQMDMLKDKSAAEYQMMATSFTKDIAALAVRNSSEDYTENIDALVSSYAKYYEKYNINITLSDIDDTSQSENTISDIELTFLNLDDSYFVHAVGPLGEPFDNYHLDYYYDVTQSITELRSIQNVLLLVGVIFSAVTALALYFILSTIFKPLHNIAQTSKKIADGHYTERIAVKGKNEVAAMAEDFNRMADEIENHIRLLEEEADQKQQFVDNFAHEIRTPLTSIYGYAEYLQKTALNEEELIESTQFIIDEAGHMKKLANSLLELATLRHNQLVQSKIYLPELFEYIAQAMKTVLAEKHMHLTYTCEAAVLNGQEDLIKSLLLNLCNNAVQACQPDKGIIELHAYRQKEQIVLSVADNGHGISKENLAKVTDAFYRVDKARSRKQGGAGLGLAICRQIADVHGADLQISSELNKGTTIKIIFTSS